MKTNSLIPSNKRFGFFLSFVFGLLAIYSILFLSNNFIIIFFILSFSVLLITFLTAKILYPLNFLWFHLGLLLGKIFSPIIISLLFFVVVSPIAMISRLLGRDELNLRKKQTNTYWVKVKKKFSKKTFFNQY